MVPNYALFSIVFVHGLTGNRENTWTCNSTLWPETLLPQEIPEARILAFGYDADVVNFWLPAGQNRIGNHAQNLAQSLANLRDRTETVSYVNMCGGAFTDGRQPSRPIFFVAQSLGGLVCENVSILLLYLSLPLRFIIMVAR